MSAMQRAFVAAVRDTDETDPRDDPLIVELTEDARRTMYVPNFTLGMLAGVVTAVLRANRLLQPHQAGIDYFGLKSK